MKKLPTDREILQAIFDMYFDEYARFDTDNSIREDKIYMPIDVKRIAAKLDAEGDIVFGRLHYHLDHKFSYGDTVGHRVAFVQLEPTGRDTPMRTLIHFPYMASVLADLRNEHHTARNNFIAAAISAVGAILSAVFAFGGTG